jgi:hypothetical protein
VSISGSRWGGTQQIENQPLQDGGKVRSEASLAVTEVRQHDEAARRAQSFVQGGGIAQRDVPVAAAVNDGDGRGNRGCQLDRRHGHRRERIHPRAVSSQEAAPAVAAHEASEHARPRQLRNGGEGGTADGDDGIDRAAQADVAQRHEGTHRGSDSDDPCVVGASDSDHGLEVVNLAFTEGRPAGAGAVTTEIGRVHGEPAVHKGAHQPDDPAIPLRPGESMAEDDRHRCAGRPIGESAQDDTVGGGEIKGGGLSRSVVASMCRIRSGAR